MRGHWRDGLDAWFGRHLAGAVRLAGVLVVVGLVVKGAHG
jgi:hypothetical protein